MERDLDKPRAVVRSPDSILPRRVVAVLDANRDVVEAYVRDRTPFNKHKMHTMLSANGFASSIDREKYIRVAVTSRRWGKG